MYPQAGHTDRGWSCVLERMEWEEGKEEGEEEGGEGQGGGIRNVEEFDFKERRREEIAMRRRKSDSDSVRLPGQFEVSLRQLNFYHKFVLYSRCLLHFSVTTIYYIPLFLSYVKIYLLLHLFTLVSWLM